MSNSTVLMELLFALLSDDNGVSLTSLRLMHKLLERPTTPPYDQFGGRVMLSKINITDDRAYLKEGLSADDVSNAVPTPGEVWVLSVGRPTRYFGPFTWAKMNAFIEENQLSGFSICQLEAPKDGVPCDCCGAYCDEDDLRRAPSEQKLCPQCVKEADK